MALLERYRVLVWAGGALLGWVAGDIMSTDPAVIGWLGAATAHDLHNWAGRVGALFVVGTGLFLVRRHRALQPDDIMAGVGVVVWILADVVIEASIDDAHEVARWIARGVLAVALTAGYAISRSRRRVGTEEA